MDKVLELSIRAVIRHLNGDMTEFNKYKIYVTGIDGKITKGGRDLILYL